MYRAYYYVTHLLYKPTFFSISLRIMSPKPPPTHPTLEINQPKQQQQQHLHLILCAAFFDIQSYHRFCNDMLLYIINLTKKTNKYQMGSCSLKNYADQIYTMITMRIILAFYDGVCICSSGSNSIKRSPEKKSLFAKKPKTS